MGGQTISPAFNSATTSYTTTVLSTTASVKVEAFTSQPNATIIVNGIAVASGTASQSIPLTFGNNTITTVVIAQDGVTTDTYTSTVIRQPSNIATLMLLQISGQTISPAFNSATTSYTSTVSNATASVKIGVFTSNANATVTVNGTAVASGAASQSIPLLIGANTITTVVTAQDGVTTDTYTITLTRLPSNIAALALLQISGQTISPAFNAATTSYTSTVSNATTSVKVEAFCASYSAITVNGTAVTSGVASQSIPLAIGPNTITTVITAQDGVTTNTYTIIVTRLPSNIATLALLQISGQTLSPVFTTATTSYTSTVASTTTSVKVEAFVNNANATIKVNGIAVVSGAASQSIPLVLGSNTITTVVTAQDGATTDTYTINVIRPPSNVATLTALQINGIPIPLNYSSASTSYSTTVPNIIASLSVVAYLSNPNATITVDGFTIASGVALPNIPLSVGNNTVTVVVLAQDGVTKDTYSVTVTRLPSSIATLSLLQISGQTISPAFSASTTSYASTVPSTTASVNVEAFATNANETITVNGTSVASATLSQSIPLAFGSNTITTAVTAQDGVTRQTYTITVTRPLSNIATLALLQVSGATLSPTFNAATTAYTSTVANTVASVKVEGTTTSANATMTVNGTVVASATLSQSIPLVVGSNTITTIVTAQDGVTKQTYTVTVTRQPATIATLTLLQVSGASLSPAFATATTSYTTTVPGTTASVNVEAYTTNANATITVNGTAVASATLSQSIPLTFGNNTITTVVTAQDGVTTDTYTIMVTREPSAIATLNLLQISGETISPTFSTATTSYTSNVPNTISSVAVVAYTSNSFATITVNGTAVTSGAASPALPLNVGANTITTVVTAQDGATTDTYTITVTRAAPSTALRGIDINGVFHPENSFVNDDNIAVHTAVSPNGDGVNDVLTIDGISAYPDNTLTLMNQGGAIIYQAKGYDNYSRAFDGHSNKTGAMQSPGTYFYMLQYKVGDQTKSKTGYIVLKY